MSDSEVGVYVYGVAANAPEEPISVRGVGGARVQVIGDGGLVALTSSLAEPTLTAADVRAHWRVLEDAFAQGTVLPIRFATVLQSEADVRERLLDGNRERLSQLLRDMDGLVQLNVKGRYDEEELLRHIVMSSPAVAELRERLGAAPDAAASRSEQLRLGQLVDAEIAACRENDTEVALAELEPLAVAAQSDEVSHPNAFKLAFLMERDGEKRLSEGVARLRERLGERVAIRYVGPLPPFSFAEAELAAGSGAWA
jgi:hypothetical protein